MLEIALLLVFTSVFVWRADDLFKDNRLHHDANLSPSTLSSSSTPPHTATQLRPHESHSESPPHPPSRTPTPTPTSKSKSTATSIPSPSPTPFNRAQWKPLIPNIYDPTSWTWGERRFFASHERDEVALSEGGDIVDMMPEKFDSRAASPCWSGFRGHNLTCLPAFFVPGVSKSGTTSLCTFLFRHPQIIKGRVKENFFWEHSRFSPRPIEEKLEWYTGLYSDLASSITQVIDQHTPRDPVKLFSIDGTASTMLDMAWRPDRREGMQNGYISHVETMSHMWPDFKFVIILRNPVSRLLSSFWHLSQEFNGQLNKEDEADVIMERFHEDCNRTIARINECVRVRSTIYDCFDQWHAGKRLKSACDVQSGIYAPLVAQYLWFFPKDQIKVLRLDDMHADREGMLDEIFTFLGLESKEQLPSEQWADIVAPMSSHQSNQGSLHRVVSGPPKNETLHMLNDFYNLWNKELDKLLGPPEDLDLAAGGQRWFEADYSPLNIRVIRRPTASPTSLSNSTSSDVPPQDGRIHE